MNKIEKLLSEEGLKYKVVGECILLDDYKIAINGEKQGYSSFALDKMEYFEFKQLLLFILLIKQNNKDYYLSTWYIENSNDKILMLLVGELDKKRDTSLGEDNRLSCLNELKKKEDIGYKVLHIKKEDILST